MQKNAISLIGKIREKANKLIIEELESKNIIGIVPSHGDILYVLFDREKCTMKELAEKIHRTKPTVTVLIDKLVSLGLVIKEKSVEDNRITYVKLTNKGVNFKPIFEEISEKLNSIVYKNLNNKEAENFERYLEQVNKNFILNK